MIRFDGSQTRPPRKSARITVSLSAKQHDILVRLAARNDVSLSWITRRAIEDYIESNSPTPGRAKKAAGRG